VAYRHIEPLSKQITIVVGLSVVGLMALGLALSFYRNVLFEQTLEDIDAHNEELRRSIEEGKRQLEYYRSAQYKDKHAKEQLGKVKPGENVLIIAEKTDRTLSAATPDPTIANEQEEAAFYELLRQMPVIEHWKLYFFHRDQINELKRSP